MTYKCKTCPECGQNMKDIDNVKHAIGHWGVKPNEIYRMSNEEARARYVKLTEKKIADIKEV